MGRRSFGLSLSSIERMLASNRAQERERERIALINSQEDIKTEQKPTYELESFDFDEHSKVAHLEILESKKYRKIIKYVTQNYERYPIYGDWSTKTKVVKKTIKLTNSALENLDNNEDLYIRRFAYEIIVRIKDDAFYPSWFIIDSLKDEFEYETGEIGFNYSLSINPLKKEIKEEQKQISDFSNTKNELIHDKELFEKLVNKYDKKLAKANNKKHLVLFTIITFGIYYIFHSKKYIKKYENKRQTVLSLISKKDNEIKELQEKIIIEQKKIDDSNKNIAILEKERDAEIQRIKESFDERISNVDKLPTNLDAIDKENFIPLKKYVGMDYSKTIGCYIIHNTINDRCYVGQSKDVFRRIKQHFKGTMPTNTIFAEDYYSTDPKLRDSIFEIKIIPLNTKDELDRTEKSLIEEYEARTKGYNGTSGNN